MRCRAATCQLGGVRTAIICSHCGGFRGLSSAGSSKPDQEHGGPHSAEGTAACHGESRWVEAWPRWHALAI